MSRWFTVEESAARVGKSTRTIRRWIDDEGMDQTRGLVREEVLLKMDAVMRERGARRGRPRASSQKADLMSEAMERAAAIAETASTGREAADLIRRENRLA